MKHVEKKEKKKIVGIKRKRKTKVDITLLKEEEFKKLMPKLKKKKLDKIKDEKKRLYYYQCWYLTESKPLHKLKNFKQRGFNGYHLDHIFPISIGFQEGISPEIISDMRNLRFIKSEYNLKKGFKVTQTARTIINEIKKSKRKKV